MWFVYHLVFPLLWEFCINDRFLIKYPYRGLSSALKIQGHSNVMRVLRKIQETNFELLTKEILSKGVTAALPKNLPDRWLRTLGRDVVRSQKAAMAGKNTTNDIDIAGRFF